jgi:ATP-binding cassette subfamily B protein
MSQEKTKAKVLDISLFSRVLSLTKPYKSTFYFCIALSIILAPITMLRPILTGKAINSFIYYKNFEGLLIISLIIVGLLILEFILRYFFTYRTEWLGLSIIKDMRVNIFRHISHLRLSFFDKTPIGTATTRTINDLESINEVFGQGSISILADLILIVSVMAYMLIYNWKLGLASMTTLPFFVYATYRFKEGIKVSFQKVRAEVARINAFLQEHITGVKIIQLFNAYDREYKKFDTINQSHLKANIDSIWHYAVFFPIVEILSTISVSFMIGTGAFLLLYGKIDLAHAGDLATYIMLINMLYRPLRMLADKFNTLQMGMVASERVFHIMDTQEFIKDNGKIIATKLQGKVSFKNVSFEYIENVSVLKNISFEIEAGKTLAIVGATGSGKTSTIGIISRFYEYNSGEVLIDDKNIRDYTLASLRGNMAVVLQDVFLFKGSIYDNITLGDTSISLEKVKEVSQLLGLHDFIMTLPGNYMYEVKERGVTLSVGQRQLISFVRALVSDPSILILDEATSSVDTHSEILIQSAIEKMIKGRTAIIIAHRLSTIKHADKILVFEQGNIIEQGSHQDLMLHSGNYKNLYEMQFGSLENV